MEHKCQSSLQVFQRAVVRKRKTYNYSKQFSIFMFFLSCVLTNKITIRNQLITKSALMCSFFKLSTTKRLFDLSFNYVGLSINHFILSFSKCHEKDHVCIWFLGLMKITDSLQRNLPLFMFYDILRFTFFIRLPLI